MLLIGATLGTWFKLLFQNRFNLSLKKIPQVFIITMFVVFLTPFGWIETLLCGQKLNEYKLESDPLFILGHYRNGTTFLQELLIRNPNHIYLTVFESIFPKHFMYFEKYIKGLFNLFLPDTRPQDDVKYSGDSPHEHEFAVANLCALSSMCATYFPQNNKFYGRFAFINGLSKKQKDKIIHCTKCIIKKLHLKKGNKLLILKNPVDTARIDSLLVLFPNARFVHIYRNPYEVFYSLKRVFKTTGKILSLQKENPNLDDFILSSYRDIYTKFYMDKQLIPRNNLVEIKFEEFIDKPVFFLKLIYDKLNLIGFEDALPEITDYLIKEKDYQKHQYEISKVEKQNIYSHWQEIIDKMGY